MSRNSSVFSGIFLLSLQNEVLVTGAVGVADVGADVGSVVDAGSAGTTVIGSASGGCDMMGAGECKRNMGQNQAERQKKKKQGDRRR